MIKNILFLLTLNLSATAFAAEEGTFKTAENSQNYIESFLNYLDGAKINSDALKNLSEQISEARSSVSSSQQSLIGIEADLVKKRERHQSLPSKISALELQNTENSAESQRIFEEHFPNESSISSVIEFFTQKRQDLVTRRGRLETSLSENNTPFDEQISTEENLISRYQTQINDLQNKQSQNQRDVNDLSREIKKLRQEINEVQNEIESPAFIAKYEAAQTAFEEIEATRIAEGLNCRKRKGIFGLGGFRDNSATCKTFRTAQKIFQRLRPLVDGSLINEKRASLDDFIESRRTLRAELSFIRNKIPNLNSDIRTAQSQIRLLKENQSVTTRPFREALAQVEFELDSTNREWSHVQKLNSLNEKNKRNLRKIERYNIEQTELPSLISRLEVQAASLNSRLQNEQSRLTAVVSEKNNLSEAVQQSLLDIESKRLEMIQTLEEEGLRLALAQGNEPLSTSTVIFESRDWNVMTSDNDIDWGQESCKAETTLTTSVENIEMSASLSVVNLMNTKGLYNEPFVAMTVSIPPVTVGGPAGLDLNSYKKVRLRASSSRTSVELDLVYSMSDEEHLVFVAKLSDRAELIKLIAAKNRMHAKLLTSEDKSEDISFSLRGSSNALKSSRSNSLAKACGGIEIRSF